MRLTHWIFTSGFLVLSFSSPGILTGQSQLYIRNHDGSATVDDLSQVRKITFHQGTVTDIDGNVYKTLQVGNQIWMVENLRVRHYRNGDPIPNLPDTSAWENTTSGAYVWYENDSSFHESYGILYNWYAATDGRSIAPEGWHVPTDADWWSATAVDEKYAWFRNIYFDSAATGRYYYNKQNGFSIRCVMD